MDWDPAADAWFAGFADGEATFLLNHNHSPRWGQQAVNPRFTVHLRADEIAVLRQLQATFGGGLSLRPARGGAAPEYFWNVSSKAHMLRLVRYFDRFPLRAKKARDYAVWREGVLLYAAQGGVRPYEQLLALRNALREGRQFVALQGAPERRAAAETN